MPHKLTLDEAKELVERYAQFDESQHPRDKEGKFSEKEMTGDDVAKVLLEQFGNVQGGKSHEYFKDRWVNSEKFVKMEIPIDAATPATKVQPGAKSYSSGPIIVDLNKTGMGRHEGLYGAPAEILIIDGKHRQAHAKENGKKVIEAYVGEKAIPLIESIIRKKAKEREGISEVVRNFVKEPNGTTIRRMKEFLTDKEIERVRAARKKIAAGEEVESDVLMDYPELKQ